MSLKIINLMRDMLSWEDVIMLLKEHIALMESGAPNGKDFLAKTCILVAAKHDKETEDDESNSTDLGVN